ncbi:MAG: zinc ribbon domain-containing protein [Ruminococcus flavefaciens]|nr:zinc ribbon domain-containing protein [Ruminococcus flavefaciens]MCM1234316.1 zinc ribbon domain-containing protein [Ruminococcus flavefaciens]
MKKGNKNVCPKCRAEIPEGMAFCTSCMEIIEKTGPVEIESRYKPKINRWFAGIVITSLCILIAMFAVMIFMLSKRDVQPESQSVALPFSEETTTAEQVTDVQTATAETTLSATSVSSAKVVTGTIVLATIAVTEYEEPSAVQAPQADFETLIREGFASWTGLGDSDTLAFDGYSCTFSDKLMGENVNCTLSCAEDLKSYVLTVSGDEYSTGSFANGIDEPIRAFTQIILDYSTLHSGDIIRSAVREMLSNRDSSCHIEENNFSCDVEYSREENTVTVRAELS